MSVVFVGALILLNGCSSTDTAIVGGTEGVAETTVVVDSTFAVDSTLVTDSTLVEDSLAADSLAADTAAALEDAVASTDPSETTAPIARLADDSAACLAFAEVRAANEESGRLTNEMQLSLLSAITAGSDATEDVDAALNTFLRKFAEESKTIVPKLQGAYATLRKELPQFATDLEDIEDVTVEALEFLRQMDASKFETFETDLAKTIGTDRLMNAGLKSLEIDKFSRAACDIPFANT